MNEVWVERKPIQCECGSTLYSKESDNKIHCLKPGCNKVIVQNAQRATDQKILSRAAQIHIWNG